MSPVLGPARRTVFLLGIALLASLAFGVPVSAQTNETAGDNETASDNETDANATGGETPTGGAGGSSDLGVPGDAPAPGEGKLTRVLTFGVIEEGCPAAAPPPCFDVLTLVANPGDTVVLHGDFRNSPGVHNIHQTLPEDGPKTSLAPNALHTISFTMPESGDARIVCDAHATTMILDVKTPAAAAESGGAHASVPAMGVHFLAYWVGVIAFAILFIVYGLTFFLFKYNETRATTDHWDRSETPGESKRLAAIAPILAVVIAVAAIAAITYVVMR